MNTISYFRNNASTQTVQIVSEDPDKNNFVERSKKNLVRYDWDHSLNDLIHFFDRGSLGVNLPIHTTAIRINTQSDVHSGSYFATVEINSLITKSLRRPLSVYIEVDGNGYIARSVDLPLYSFEDDIQQAINSLRIGIESLINELNEDDNFSEEWLNYKSFLNSIIY